MKIENNVYKFHSSSLNCSIAVNDAKHAQPQLELFPKESTKQDRKQTTKEGKATITDVKNKHANRNLKLPHNNNNNQKSICFSKKKHSSNQSICLQSSHL